MDVVVIGEQTHGKFCAGYMIDASDWLDNIQDDLDRGTYLEAKSEVENWGIYVMYARYADCNGVTLSMPDGIKPDFEVEEDLFDGCQLGDPEETLLACALAHMNGEEFPVARSVGTDAPALLRVPGKPHRPGYGLLVKDWPRK